MKNQIIDAIIVENSSKNPVPITKTNDLEQILAIVESSLVESTTHGIPHILKRENLILKAFWIVCVLVSTTYCGLFIYKSLSDYFDYETVTKTEVIDEIPSVFPTISICNLNPYMTNFANDYLEDFTIEVGLVPENSTFELTFPYLFYDTFIQMDYFAGSISYDPRVNATVKKNLGFNLSEMLMSCMYNFEPCSVNDFEWYFDSFYGNCYKFNSGRNASGNQVNDTISTKPGKINGLILELFLGENENMNTYAVSSGAHIRVHNKSYIPFFTEGIDVSTGSMTNIAIKREFISKKTYPYSECRDNIDTYDSLFVKFMKNNNESYFQTRCFLLCYQRYLITKCGCYDVAIPYWSNDYQPCVNLSQFLCVGKIFSSFFSFDVKSICSSECPLECDSISYSLSVSTSDYPSVAYANYLRKNPLFRSKFLPYTAVDDSYQTLKRNILGINLYYESLSYKHIRELEKTELIDLISNLGGQLGLFIGMSFLSFVEIIDIIIQILLKTFKSKFAKTTKIEIFINKNDTKPNENVQNKKKAIDARPKIDSIEKMNKTNKKISH